MNAKKMVEKILIPRGIKDDRVLEVMSRIPRHAFVPETFQKQAYGDRALPIGEEQTISQPFIVALMTQALELEGTERILEIGTGSGYQAAILSQLAKQVFSVERIQRLALQARKRLETLDIFNVSIRYANGQTGWKEYAPFDRILVTAAMKEEPLSFLPQLKNGGIIVAPVEEGTQQNIYRYARTEDKYTKRFISDCSFVPFITT